MFDGFPVRASQPELYGYPVRLLGTGASAPTVELGPGVTATRTGAGAYTLAWADSPGTFVAMSAGLGAATPGNLAGHEVIRDTFDASANSLDILLSDQNQAGHDLAADEYIDLIVWFKRTSV